MRRQDLSDLLAFQAVAEEQSFTRGAKRLGLSQATLSQTISKLEQRLGFRLLARTTRSVRATEAGQRLLDTLRPALAELEAEIEALAGLSDTPSGTIRLTTIRFPAKSLVLPALEAFRMAYPRVKVEIFADDAFADIVAGGFDAGIRFGHQVEQDMVAVPIGPDARAAVVATPDYFARYRVPKDPWDLARHDCINFRMASAGNIARWHFSQGGRPLDVTVDGTLVVNDGDTLEAAALAGYGLAYVFEDQVADHLSSGRLVRCLEDWCPPSPGYHLYYPSRRQRTPALVALVDMLRYRP
ncbi:LysR family transcriptional regulator [Devosia sp. 1566]|uniref:LysR family transcriptional regulator n=1 Tax=Devosia sp. 1566 TaxID=2499144 RepID=UPI000FDA4D5D|nr:LysR family transcriptional regulator [Devosia sp. 1566]